MLIVIALPTPEPFYKGTEAIPLTQSAKCVMGALCFAVIMWMTEAIPFPATSLSLIVLLHVMNIDKFSSLVKLGLGNSSIMFLMGAMGLSAAMTESGLARRFMLWMLTKVGRRTDRIVLAFITVGALTSMWVTDMAVAAMLLPLGMSILQAAAASPWRAISDVPHDRHRLGLPHRRHGDPAGWRRKRPCHAIRPRHRTA